MCALHEILAYALRSQGVVTSRLTLLCHRRASSAALDAVAVHINIPVTSGMSAHAPDQQPSLYYLATIEVQMPPPWLRRCATPRLHQRVWCLHCRRAASSCLLASSPALACCL